MKCEIKNVPLSSLVVSPLPLTLLIMGLVGGLLAFVISPNEMLEPMTPYARAMATGVFSLVYMLLVLSVIVVSAFIYNTLSALGLPGVRLNMEALSDDAAGGEPEEEEDGDEAEAA